MKERVERYFSSENAARTRSGNFAKPSLNLVARWIKETWQTFRQQDLKSYCHDALLCEDPTELYVAQEHLGLLGAEFERLVRNPPAEMHEESEDDLNDTFHNLDIDGDEEE